MKPVLMFSTMACPYCDRAEALLRSKGVAPQKALVDRDAQARERMAAMAPGRRTVPQIFIGDTHVGGFDDLARLEREGRLDALLAA